MIKRIKYENLKGHRGDQELTKLTAIVGRNGSGKTTVLDAIRLATTGEHWCKRPGEIYAEFFGANGETDAIRCKVEDDYGRTSHVDITEKSKKQSSNGVQLDPATWAASEWLWMPPRDVFRRIVEGVKQPDDQTIDELGELFVAVPDSMAEWPRWFLRDLPLLQQVDQLITAVAGVERGLKQTCDAMRAILAQPQGTKPLPNVDDKVTATEKAIAAIEEQHREDTATTRDIERIDANLEQLEKLIESCDIPEENIPSKIKWHEKKRDDALAQIGKLFDGGLSEALAAALYESGKELGGCPVCFTKGQRKLEQFRNWRYSLLISGDKKKELQAKADEHAKAIHELEQVKAASEQKAKLVSECADLLSKVDLELARKRESELTKLREELAALKTQQRQWYLQEGQKKERRDAEAKYDTANAEHQKIKGALLRLRAHKKTMATRLAVEFLEPVNEALSALRISIDLGDNGRFSIQKNDVQMAARALGNAEQLIISAALAVASADRNGYPKILIIDEASRMDDETLATFIESDFINGLDQVIICDPDTSFERKTIYCRADFSVIEL